MLVATDHEPEPLEPISDILTVVCPLVPIHPSIGHNMHIWQNRHFQLMDNNTNLLQPSTATVSIVYLY